MTKTAGARAARAWHSVIGRDGSWLLLTCGHEVMTAAHPNGRHARQRACRVCERLERNYARWVWKGLVTEADARRALRGIRKTRRSRARHVQSS